MREYEYDAIVSRLNKITDDAIAQISKATSLYMCISIFANARTKMLNEIFDAKKKVKAGVLSNKEYYLIVSRYASSQMYIFDAIKKRVFQLIDEEAVKLLHA